MEFSRGFEAARDPKVSSYKQAWAYGYDRGSIRLKEILPKLADKSKQDKLIEELRRETVAEAVLFASTCADHVRHEVRHAFMQGAIAAWKRDLKPYGE